jgi:hypothetical protein
LNEELPTKEQLPFWAELVSRVLAPLTLSSVNAVDFPAWASVLDLDSVRVAAFERVGDQETVAAGGVHCWVRGTVLEMP